MVGQVCGHRLAGLGSPEPLGYAQVHEPAAWLGELRVDRPADHLVGKGVGARPIRARVLGTQQRVTLEEVEGAQEPVEVEGHQLAQPVDAERAAEDRPPAENVSCLGRQPLHPAADERGERAGDEVGPLGEGAGHLEREEGVARALREHAVGIDLENADIRYSDLRNSDLTKANLNKTKLWGCKIRNTRLRMASRIWAWLLVDQMCLMQPGEAMSASVTVWPTCSLLSSPH